MPPKAHAPLNASSSGRWMKCTASVRFEENFPESTSSYAEEGSLAHAVAELKVNKMFTVMTKREYTSKLNKLKKDPLYNPEMDKTTDVYIEYITDAAMQYSHKPNVVAEVKVEFDDYVPEGFGTCDCVMIGDDTLHIFDYKHGKGVPVSAENNSQMRLYALGALRKYAPVYGESIKNVRMSIVQPRLENTPSSELLTVEELRAWGESIKPIAQKAYLGLGEFVPGEHCRFCRGRAKCRARANVNTALEDFKDFALPGAVNTGPEVRVLTDAEVGDLLIRGAQLVQWYKDLEEYAAGALLNGQPIEGWKLVAGRSNRAFSDQDAAFKAIVAAGYDEALLYDRKPKSLTELEKLMGKAEFAEKIGSFIIKPPGKPTLAPASDKRQAYNSAASDFAGVES